VLADISGYTRYLTGVELEHSHDVLADLLGVVAAELRAVGVLAKLEGDAVFVCDVDGTTNGETLLAALDAAYIAFVRRRRTIVLRTTCGCAACARIASLDLKLIAHHGSFVEHQVAGSSEIVGADVILAHRLLKNDVAKRTGVQAFALITDACVASLDLDRVSLGFISHSERYDDVGEVAGWVRDVGARWRDLEQRAVVRIDAADADIGVSGICPAPQAQVWDAITSPQRQLGWKVGATAIEMQNPSGARDVGSRTHCVHGRQAFDQEILDWRPFTYFSYREAGPYGPFLWTTELTNDEKGTNVNVRVKLLGGRRQRALMAVGRRRLVRTLNSCLANLASQVATPDKDEP
jgi:hypothetical protein